MFARTCRFLSAYTLGKIRLPVAILGDVCISSELSRNPYVRCFLHEIGEVVSRTRYLKTVAAVTSAAMVLSFSPAAAHAQGEPSPSSATTTSADAGQAKLPYSDEEILALFAFGTGRAAAEHPDVAAKFVPPAQVKGASEDDIRALLVLLKSIDSQYHEKVTVDVQSKDPELIQAALVRLSQDIQTYVQRLQARSGGKNVTAQADAARGSLKVGLNVLVTANAVANVNGVVWGNVAVATEAAVAAVAVWLAGIVPGSLRCRVTAGHGGDQVV
ncbi:hypothetical protein [Actinoplanes sp. NPDC020271]|uniref:hypothetical protein n=1 Tax=Actinoplanes sp. NPDC020271 TaxID=3363896 RepID=UPI0037AC6635